MILTREKPCPGARQHRLRRSSAYVTYPHFIGGVGKEYQRALRQQPAKSIKSAASEFHNPKKQWHVFISHSIVPLEKVFHDLVKEWRDDTFFQSSLSDMCFHPAYQTIMAMGKDALPFVFKDLEENCGHWFYALKFIVRNDIADGAQTFEDARERWLKWAKVNKYLL